MKKVIYITGLSHSGSTTFAYLLSMHPEAVALGEVHGVIHKKKRTLEDTEHVCSCGLGMEECPLWSLYKSKDNPIFDKEYPHIIKDISLNRINIDSSKRTDALMEIKKISKDNGFEVYPVLLIRGVRGWTLSQKRIDKLRGHGMSMVRHMTHWFMANLRMKKKLKREFGSYIEVGYTLMCENPQEIYKQVYDFINESSVFPDQNQMNHHIAYGNRMKKTFSGLSDLERDVKWKSNPRLSVLRFLLSPVFIFDTLHHRSCKKVG